MDGNKIPEAYYKLLELDFFEIGEAFDGLTQEHLWKRPSPELLSVGELAGHIAYGQGPRFAGKGGNPHADPADCPIKSILIDQRFNYYPHQIESRPTEEQLAMTPEEVLAEIRRVNEESVAFLKNLNPDVDEKAPDWGWWTYGETVKYTIFHVAYHTGQMYSARHLLGDTTKDN